MITYNICELKVWLAFFEWNDILGVFVGVLCILGWRAWRLWHLG